MWGKKGGSVNRKAYSSVDRAKIFEDVRQSQVAIRHPSIAIRENLEPWASPLVWLRHSRNPRLEYNGQTPSAKYPLSLMRCNNAGSRSWYHARASPPERPRAAWAHTSKTRRPMPSVIARTSLVPCAPQQPPCCRAHERRRRFVETLRPSQPNTRSRRS